jgi:hypothetical protein
MYRRLVARCISMRRLSPASSVADRLVAASTAYGAEHLDVFAGLLLAGGQVWLGFTADAARHLTAVQARVERPDLLRTFVADFPERALRSLQHRISADLTSLADQGVDVAMIGVDVRRNRVEVGVRSVGGAAADTLGRRYGTAMLLVRENVVVRTLEAAARDQPGPAPRTGPSDAAPPLDPDRCSQLPIQLGSPSARHVPRGVRGEPETSRRRRMGVVVMSVRT